MFNDVLEGSVASRILERQGDRAYCVIVLRMDVDTTSGL
jgi:hypothetical protein